MLPSSHGALLFRCSQAPVEVLQLSSVQRSKSLQSFCGPEVQPPLAQVSPSVQGLPSSHGAVLLVWVQPVAGLQPSSVQTSLSLQLIGAPAQTSPAQVSLL